MLKKTLSRQSLQVVYEELYGDLDLEEVINSNGGDSVERKSLRTLLPEAWLNDEVINCCCVLLRERDLSINKGNKRSHFFTSHFMDKLLDVKHKDIHKQNKHNCSNVKNWSSNVPGNNMFQLDKIFSPVNVRGNHWTPIVAFFL